MKAARPGRVDTGVAMAVARKKVPAPAGLRPEAPVYDLDEMAKKARGAADMLKALSHESRLMMLCILSDGEKSVSELEQILGERQSTVSQQLARLRFDRLVKTRREGKTIYYSLADDGVRTILGAIYEVFCKDVC